MSGYAKLVFPNGIGEDFKPSYDTAVAFWNNVINTGAPDFTFKKDTDLADSQCGVNQQYKSGDVVEGLTIFASSPAIDGEGQILGRAGPCMFNGDFPLFGIMEFDSADSNNLLESGQFGAVIVHEMGHVFGIGTLWPLNGLLNDPCPLFRDVPCDPYYNGVHGIEGYKALNPPAELGPIPPVANTGGTGTKNGHWRENQFVNELMTGYLNAGIENPLSIMTVRSIMDLGYTVNLGAAEDYVVPANLDSATREGLDTLVAELTGDILRFDHVDVNDFVDSIAVEPEQDSVQGELTAVFTVMFAGFAMLAGFMMYLQRGNRKALERLQLANSVATRSPMHNAELA